MKLNYKSMHELVEKQSNVFWNGWTAVFFTKNDNAFMKNNGSFIDGSWASVRRIDVEKDGTWVVPDKLVQ